MSVEFEESSIQRTINTTRPIKKEGKLLSFLLEKGYAKDKKQANYILLGCALLFFVLAIIFPFIS